MWCRFTFCFQENDADNIKEEPTILPNQNNEKEVVNNITENESTKKKNECILIGNEKPNIVFPKNVEIHVLESLKSNIVEILDNYDNSPDKANNVEEKNETLNIPITLVEHIDNDCVLKVIIIIYIKLTCILMLIILNVSLEYNKKFGYHKSK